MGLIVAVSVLSYLQEGRNAHFVGAFGIEGESIVDESLVLFPWLRFLSRCVSLDCQSRCIAIMTIRGMGERKQLSFERCARDM